MRSREVHLFVFDGMVDWEAGFAGSSSNRARFPVAPEGLQVRTVAVGGAVVTTLGGVRVTPEIALDELRPRESAMLILPDGKAWESGGNRAALGKVREFIAACVPVAGSGAATLALARAGLLDNRYHTGNGGAYLAASGYRGKPFYREVGAVSDQGVITASGGSAQEFAREILSALNPHSAYALDAWCPLFKYGDATSYGELSRCAPR